MEIVKIIGMIIGFLLMAIAVIAIFDARKLTKKLFGFSDQNEGSKWMKIGGFLLFIVGILILYFVF
ncbi:MAG: hypothetical protein GX682_01705 [Clostridiaceae bacterium]|nr:hypothetical protein [Clostridiaceae bacterium]